MSSSDVERLERFLTREHDRLRDELDKLNAKVDGIASRLNEVEDEHVHESARRSEASALKRAFREGITILVAIIGAVAVSEHWFR